MKPDDTPWSVVCPSLQSIDLPDYQSPVVVMDVGVRCIRLVVAAPNTELHGERSGSVVRRFLVGREVDWTQAVTWLGGADAKTLMSQLDANITRTSLWSGDVVVDWSDAAVTAANALFKGIGDSVE